MITTRITPWTPKLLIFLLPSFVGGSAFWFFVQQALRGHVIFTTVPLVSLGVFFLLGLLCLGLWLGPLLLVPYVAPWRAVRVTIAACSVVPLVPFFPLYWWTLGAGVIVVVLIAWALEFINDDMHNRLTVQPLLSLPRGIPFIIIGVLTAISLLYYQQLRSSHATTDDLSNTLIDQTVTIAERALPTLYHDYEPGMSIDQLIGAQMPTADSILNEIQFTNLPTTAQKQEALSKKLQDLGIDANDAAINTAQSQAIVKAELEARLAEFRAQTIDATRRELEQRLGVSVSGSDSVHDVLKRLVGKQFNTYVSRWVQFVPMLLALALFFILRIFTSLFQAVVVWCGWLYLKLCRGLNLVSVTHQTVPAERLQWM